MIKLARCALVLPLLASVCPSGVRAQRGDTRGEGPQVPLPVAQKIVPSPPLSAAEQLKTFALPPGFKIELVADESLVRDPVAAVFDHEGNLIVAEITRFNVGMIRDVPKLAAGVNAVPPSTIVKLESSQGDGHFNRRVVFMEGLNAPRALAVVHDGVLVADPPRLWLARDTNGDGKADAQQRLAYDYGIDLINESNANGLIWGRDNLLHNICYNFDYRYRAGKLEQRLPTQIRGEFGLTQDDYGRLFFNRNSDQLRCDQWPQYYTMRNPDLVDVPWANNRIVESQEIWPGHPTPVVNRGYRKGELGRVNGGLRDDGTLMEFSAACSPLIYRGTNFPADCYNNAFVAEPAANMIKRNLLVETDGRITAKDAYQGREFLTSTDLRFRPVALLNAPDGSMYVVDLYRGVLEEYHLITSYLLEQTVARGLDKPFFGLGRIWRISYEGGPVEKQRPNLARQTPAELVKLLGHGNGWWRDMAQQELVERGDRSAVPALETLALEAPGEVTRVAALWTLDGLEATTPSFLKRMLADKSAKVRSAAVRVHERFLRGADADTIVAQLAAVENDPAAEVIMQLALSLGESKSARALAALYRVFTHHGTDSYLPAAVVSGLHGREQEFVSLIVADGISVPRPETKAVLSLLASAIVHSGDRPRIDQLIARCADNGGWPVWARAAVLNGFGAIAQPAFRRTVTPGRLIKSEALVPLRTSSEKEIKSAADNLATRLVRYEEEAKARTKSARPLTGAERQLIEAGRMTYQICAGCHQANGEGLPNVAPSLVESPFVAGNPEMLVRIVLNGKEGTAGFPGAMPPIGGTFTDEQIAGVLSYVRNSWGLQYGGVSQSTVAKVRGEVGPRLNAWTNAELGLLERELAKAAK
jgi:mono/diheme cytochrome c family protein/glucose/arabinose dehydrogenase